MSIADPTQPPIPRNDPLIRAHGRSRIEHTFRVKLRLDRSKTVVIASVEGALLVLLLEIGLERKKKKSIWIEHDGWMKGIGRREKCTSLR